MVPARADLFRLLGDEDRLRLLALCAEEELTVGELAVLLDESQPQITKKSQPLRESGLLAARRDGTRTLLKIGGDVDVADPVVGPIVGAALEEGRALCSKDGSLSRVASIVAQREETARKLFETSSDTPVAPIESMEALGELVGWLPILAPLLPGRALAVDIGTGEGPLLPVLSPLYERVVAVDRSPARLARCAARIAAWGLPNVRLREGDVDDTSLVEDIRSRGGADLVVLARMLHFAARPKDAIAAATRLVRDGGHLVLVDYLPHTDESLREQGHVWLGFDPAKLRTWLQAAQLDVVVTQPLPTRSTLPLQLAVAKRAARDN